MCTPTSTDTHLVTFRVGIEWRTIPLTFGGFVLAEFWHFKSFLYLHAVH